MGFFKGWVILNRIFWHWRRCRKSCWFRDFLNGESWDISEKFLWSLVGFWHSEEPNLLKHVCHRHCLQCLSTIRLIVNVIYICFAIQYTIDESVLNVTRLILQSVNYTNKLKIWPTPESDQKIKYKKINNLKINDSSKVDFYDW